MKCNHCDAELEEGVTRCPNCGTDNAPAEEIPQAVEEAAAEPAEVTEETPREEAPEEEKEAPAEENPANEASAKEETPIVEGKMTPGKIALLVVVAVAAIAVVIALIVGAMSGRNDAADPTDAEGTTAAVNGENAEATIPADGNPDDVTCKGTYTVTDQEAVDAKDIVVATLGDAELTNAELQIYYWSQVYNFLNQYSSYASYFGLDYTQPLDTQISVDGATTWQQYMLTGALNAWQSYSALGMQAEEAGFEMPEDYVTHLESIPSTLESTAASAGFADVQEMIESEMGAGTDLESYITYLTEYYMSALYFEDQAGQITVTDADAEAYFDEKADSYAESGIEKNDEKYVDVRHILIMPEGGTTDEATGATTYTEEEWEAARVTAQGILDQWLAGEATEDSFSDLAAQYSMDGNASQGGIYENVYKGQMVEPFETWCFDDSRQYGDSGLVQTEYGYHVMFFVGSSPAWLETARSDLQSEKENSIAEKAISAYTMEVDYSAIVLGLVDMSGS